VREGTSGDTFYIISEGDVRVTQTKVSTKLFEKFVKPKSSKYA
jgi:hypothetical protein